MPAPRSAAPASRAKHAGFVVVLVGLLSVLLIATGQSPVLSATPEQAPAANRPSKQQEVKSVRGHNGVAESVPDVKREPARPARVTWPAAGSAEVAVPTRTGRSGDQARAGELPVSVGPAAKGTAPGKVRVEVLAERVAERAGVDGLLLKLRRADGTRSAAPVRVTVDYTAFRDAYGGDWASRLSLTPEPSGPPVTVVRNDVEAGTLTADVTVGSADSTFALAAAPEGSAGDYKATSLSPSGKWAVATQGGGFSWSYDLRTPPVPGGLAPTLAASYSSNAVDGRTASTNNQASWLGEGWDLSPGFIERSYKGCGDDLDGNNGKIKTGDMCWEGEQVSLSLGQHSGPLVKDGSSWRLKKDDGTRVQQKFSADNGDDNGEYWVITTPDGTQYHFGMNKLFFWQAGKPVTNSAWTMPVFGNDAGEPCYESTYDASQCQQAYRWNLDYVSDPDQNSMAYYYDKQEAQYGANLGKRTASYTRSGTLARIEYGLRRPYELGMQAPARVVFESADRCVPGQNCALHNATSWPDVPWDNECAAPCSAKISPTFWTTKRLAKITTQVSTGGGNYRDVDRWDFAHSYPSPGDGTTAALYLDSITQTGLAGPAGTTPITLPPVRFIGTLKPNRMNTPTDGLPALNKNRITAIQTESGAKVNVTYAEPDCAPGAVPAAAGNTKLCYPVKWSMPPAGTVTDDWFYKYVVKQIVEDDLVTDSKDMVTNYDYVGGGAWAYDDNPLTPQERRTWSQWRGFEKVIVRKGDPTNDLNKPESKTVYQYHRGMHGDRTASGGAKTVHVADSTGAPVADEEQYAGFLRERISYDGTAVTAGSINTPWSRLSATQGTERAHQVQTVRTVSRTALATGGFRTTQVDTSYDNEGNVTQVNDLGQVHPAKTDDDKCTTTAYVKNTDAWIVNLPSRTTTVAVACGSPVSLPGDAISDSRSSYDGAAFGSAPTRGNTTRTETVKGYAGSTPQWLTVSQTAFDHYGRPTETKDALNRTSTTTYAQTNDLLTSITTKNPLGHATTSALDPALGQPTKVADANDRVTSISYDAVGRLRSVWKPGRSQAAGDSPHLRYTYGLRTDGPTWVKTETLKANGNLVSGYQLYDGFLRERQTQTPSPRGGRVVADAIYDSRGLVNIVRAPYYNNAAAPGNTLFQPKAGEVPNATVKVYDGAERETASIYLKLNVEQWRTTIQHGGDRTTVVPPAGAQKVTTVIDAQGQTTAMLQHKPGGAFDTTSYGYTKRGDLASIKDQAGNEWTYKYDLLGRKIESKDPDKGLSTATYDDAGQPVTSTDARGKTVRTKHDDLGRVVETRLGSESGTVLTRSVYDTLTKGAVTSSTRYVEGAAYTRAVSGYDVAGRPTGATVTIPSAEGALAGDYTTTTTYAEDGQVASTKVPALGDLSAETLTYNYDDLGQQLSLSGASTYVAAVEYTALGEKSQVALGPVGKRLWQTSYYEDGTRRLTQQLTERESGGGLFLADQHYGYDPAGNVTRLSQRTTGQTRDTQCIGYDYLRRVTEVWTNASTTADACAAAPTTSNVAGPAPYWHQYGYDASGNRKTLTRKGLSGAADATSSYGYPATGSAQPHGVRSVATGTATASYSYDPAGNTVGRPGPSGVQQKLNWDDAGLLESIESGTKKTSYVYDAEGAQLIRRDEDGSVTLFVGGGEVRLESGTEKGTRYYDGVGIRTSTGLTWTVADRHNTAQVAVKSSDLSVSTRRQDLFGNPRSGETAIPGSRGFVGGIKNDATGLTRLGAREYDPVLGTFASVDPVIDPTNPQQLTAYPYASHSPATLTDPSGLIADYDDCRCNYNGNTAKIAAAKEQEFKNSGLNRATFNEEKRSIREYSQKRLNDHRVVQAQKTEAARKAAECDWWCRRGRDVNSVASAVHKGVKDVVTSDAWAIAGMVVGLAAPICPPCGVISVGMSVASAAYECGDGMSTDCGLALTGAVLGGAGLKLKALSRTEVTKPPPVRYQRSHREARASYEQRVSVAAGYGKAEKYTGYVGLVVGIADLNFLGIF
jgi:RHS repeat-associated protein